MTRTNRLQVATTIGVLLSVACGGGSGDATGAPPITRHLDAAELAGLPVDTLAELRQVCLATGYDACPLHFAVATRLNDSEIALWEPGHAVSLLRSGDSLPRPLGTPTGVEGSYGTVMAIRQDGRGYEIIDIVNGTYGVVQLDAAGKQTSRAPLPHVGGLASLGYLAGEPVVQDIQGGELGQSGILTVRRLKSPTDSIGTLMLKAPVSWMQRDSLLGATPRPFFVASPVWSRLAGGDLVWSPGSPFRVERRAPTADGAVKWILTGPDGPPVNARDLDLREATIRQGLTGIPLTDEDFDLMRSRSDSTIAPVTGFVPFPDGGLLIMGAVAPSMPTTTWIRLDPDGVPVSQFELDSRARVLLAEGDSLLVHRPTESEPWEVVWLRLDPVE